MYTYAMIRIQRFLATVLTLFFIGGIFLCVGSVSVMNHSMSAGMPCPIASDHDGCSTPSDHLSYWSNILSVIPADFAALVLALAAACACTWLASRGIWNPVKQLSLLQQATSPPLILVPRHALQEAFSNGILHPKLYHTFS